MSQLSRNLSSAYIGAMNRLGGRRAARRVVAYVESYDDVLFWSALLRPLETDGLRFEVMLPSRDTLSKGKKTALANDLGERLGECMIACVDADYDYLMQGATPVSRTVCGNPYVFHTYAYAIENLQCYAPALSEVCVMATLNDRRSFDFEAFLSAYSETVWPLFVWNVWAYRHGRHKTFSMVDFYHTVQLPRGAASSPGKALEKLRCAVNAKVSRLQRQFPEGKSTYKPLREELLRLGLTPQTTYLYMRGHDLFDGVVAPLLYEVCDGLRREREREIRALAEHELQMDNELSSYRHAAADVVEMLRKHTGYTGCPLYVRVQGDVRRRICAPAAQGRKARAQGGADGKEETGETAEK